MRRHKQARRECPGLYTSKDPMAELPDGAVCEREDQRLRSVTAAESAAMRVSARRNHVELFDADGSALGLESV